MKHASLSFAAIGFSALLFLTGCANSSGPVVSSSATTSITSPSATSNPSGTGTSANVTLTTRETPLGRIIVGGNGRTVYYFTNDMRGSGKSSCMNDCRQKWLPVLVDGDPVVEGITAKVGTITTPDGKKHLTIDDMPVYYWYLDKNPGDTFGQDVGKVWYVIAPNGMMMRNKVSGASPSSSPISTPTTTSP